MLGPAEIGRIGIRAAVALVPLASAIAVVAMADQLPTISVDALRNLIGPQGFYRAARDVLSPSWTEPSLRWLLFAACMGGGLAVSLPSSPPLRVRRVVASLLLPWVAYLPVALRIALVDGLTTRDGNPNSTTWLVVTTVQCVRAVMVAQACMCAAACILAVRAMRSRARGAETLPPWAFVGAVVATAAPIPVLVSLSQLTSAFYPHDFASGAARLESGVIAGSVLLMSAVALSARRAPVATSLGRVAATTVLALAPTSGLVAAGYAMAAGYDGPFVVNRFEPVVASEPLDSRPWSMDLYERGPAGLGASYLFPGRSDVRVDEFVARAGTLDVAFDARTTGGELRHVIRVAASLGVTSMRLVGRASRTHPTDRAAAFVRLLAPQLGAFASEPLFALPLVLQSNLTASCRRVPYDYRDLDLGAAPVERFEFAATVRGRQESQGVPPDECPLIDRGFRDRWTLRVVRIGLGRDVSVAALYETVRRANDSRIQVVLYPEPITSASPTDRGSLSHQGERPGE